MTPSIRSFASGQAGSATNVPSGVVNGDILIAFAYGSSPQVPPTTTPPTGWSTVVNLSGGSSIPRSYKMDVFTKIASGEPSSYIFGGSTAALQILAVQNSTGIVTSGFKTEAAQASDPFVFNPITNNFSTGPMLVVAGFWIVPTPTPSNMTLIQINQSALNSYALLNNGSTAIYGTDWDSSNIHLTYDCVGAYIGCGSDATLTVGGGWGGSH